MPRGRSNAGGRRQGTPGKGYSNRTDLMGNYQAAASAMPRDTPAPAAPAGPPTPAPPMVTPDQVPKLDDPTARPNEPVTSRPLTAQFGWTPPVIDPSIAAIRAAYQANPTPQLQMVLMLMADRTGMRNV